MYNSLAVVSYYALRLTKQGIQGLQWKVTKGMSLQIWQNIKYQKYTLHAL